MISTAQDRGSPRYFLFNILYIMQCVGAGLIGTLLLTYKVYPSYSMLSLLSVAGVPHQTKFIIAPITEKYTSFDYGRRKTWVVCGTVGMGVACFLLSYYTDASKLTVAIVLSFFITLFLVVQDISLDALVLKEIQKPQIASFVQTSGLAIGEMIGSLVFIKLVSRDFGIRVGLEEKIMSPSTFIVIAAVALLGLAIYFHFSYIQPQLNQEIETANQNKSLWETFKVYKVFLMTKRKEFRLSIVFLVIFQGCLFYYETYVVQLINKGYSREQLKQFENLSLVLVLLFCYFYNKLAPSNPYTSLQLSLFARCALYLIGFIFAPSGYYNVLFYTIADQILSAVYAMNSLTCINSLKLNKYTAMIICMLNSVRNWGENSALHLWIVGKVGFRVGCYIGGGIQLIVLIFIGRLMEWVEEGEDEEFQVEE